MANARLDNVLARKLSAFAPLSPDEARRLVELQSPITNVRRGKQLVQEGQAVRIIYVMQTGWACSYKDLPTGKRQIISFPIAGDCVGLRSAFLGTADHSCETLTDAMVSGVDRAQMFQTFNQFPRLGMAILWAASRDEAMVIEHLVSIGRRSGIERTAHFFVEVAERLNLIGAASGTEFECPLNQYVLADALGLTPIHINRVLGQLRDQELLTVKRGIVTIHDLRAVRKLAGLRDAGALTLP